jgi:hypothetical protein
MTADKTFTCSTCHAEDHWLTEFPNSTCLACWTIQEHDTPVPTAAEIAAMWGGRSLANSRRTRRT